MKRLDVVCFGEVLWDFYQLDASDRFRRVVGGASANVAVALARLGARVAAVGGIGDDSLGDALVAELAGEGVDTRWLLRRPSRTGITFVAGGVRGEPRFLNYRHASADQALSVADVRPRMGGAHFALLGTTTIRPVAVAARFLEVARAENVTAVVDLNVRPHLFRRNGHLVADAARLVRHAALVKASHDDLEAIAPGRGLAWLARHAPRATWLVTHGAGPASAIGAHGKVHAVARRARCVDATGAGDAFLAGVLAVLLATRAAPGTRAWADARVWEAALSMGHGLGARAVARRGAATGLVRLDAVRRRLRSLSRAVLS